MKSEFNKTTWWERLNKRYQFNYMDEENYEVKPLTNSSFLQLLVYFAFSALLIGFLTYAIIAFTPLKQYIPGYGKVSEKKRALEHQYKMDSLEVRANQNNFKMLMIEKVLKGEFDTAGYTDNFFNENYDSLVLYSESIEDSILRAEVEQRERYSIFDTEESKGFDIGNVDFYPPVRGVVSDSFNASEDHFGVDLVTAKNPEVKTIYDGRVVFANFTVEHGYVLGIYHGNELLSVYKHNKALRKQVGEKVRQGEVVAIVGNTGELTSGPHLHLEIWNQGEAVDPLKYINFEK